MGASAWHEPGPYDEDFSLALRAAQEIKLRSVRPDVASIDDLWRDEEWLEYVGSEGTGSVLDLYKVVGADEPDDFATLRPMPAAAFRTAIGVWRRPEYSDFVEAYANDRLPQPQARGSARCAVVYRDGKPCEIVYWGLTAD